MNNHPKKSVTASEYPVNSTFTQKDSIDWIGALPFIGLHLACLFVFVVGWSPVALIIAFIVYFVRCFFLTGGYHRYFSHRSYKTSRVFQFLLALGGTTAVQMGPLWWAAHHRNHHRYSDEKKDVHSPVTHSFWWAHIGWVMSSQNYNNVDQELIKDFYKYPELRWLDKWCLVPPILFAAGLLMLGNLLQAVRPEWGTSGPQMLIWAFFISTVLVHHGTFCVNSVCHVLGSQRFATGDQSRNNLIVALLTGGEGWHNNHHQFPMSERQGMRWWEIDTTHYILKLLSMFGIVHSLRKPTQTMINTAPRTK